jgi:hypothetical protein
MATLPTQVIGQTGAEITFGNASVGGDACATGDGVKLLVKNGSGSSITVTLVTPGKVDGDLDIADRTFTVAAGEIGAIPMTDRYRDKATGLATVTYSSATSVEVAVIR